MTNYTEFQKLSSKDIQSLLSVSESTSYLILKDIKQHYNLTSVLYYHFKNYYKIVITS